MNDLLEQNVINVIEGVFSCSREDIIETKILKKGMTNRSYRFSIGDDCYIIRIPGTGTNRLIDREAEAATYKKISGLFFCEDPIYINSKNGMKITRFIHDVRVCDPTNDEDVRLCMTKLKRFHEYENNGKRLEVRNTFDLFHHIVFYEQLRNGIPSIYEDYEKTKDNCFNLRRYIDEHKLPYQLTHIDAVSDNFLFDPHADGELSIQLTDWEYSGMQDPHVDIAMFAIYSLYDKERIDWLIDTYFGQDGGCNLTTRIKIYCYVAVCGLIWSNWCEYKRSLGVEFGDYSYCQYKFARDYYQYAVELMEKIGES